MRPCRVHPLAPGLRSGLSLHRFSTSVACPGQTTATAVVPWTGWTANASPSCYWRETGA